MFAPRIFKRLEIASQTQFGYDPFFLEALAYNQWHLKPPFSVGPKMAAYPAHEHSSYWGIAYNISNTLRYYMKPHKIAVFGNDVMNLEKSHLLVRGWFESTAESNNLLLMMERYDVQKDGAYWFGVNNSSWRIRNWGEINNAQKIHQTLVRTDSPSTGCYDVQMELQ